jgi:hypothetical protein
VDERYRGPNNPGITAVHPTSSFARVIMGVGFGARAVVAVDGNDHRQRGREQAIPSAGKTVNLGQPTGLREHLRGVIELKARAVSAASSLAPGPIVP